MVCSFKEAILVEHTSDIPENRSLNIPPGRPCGFQVLHSRTAGRKCEFYSDVESSFFLPEVCGCCSGHVPTVSSLPVLWTYIHTNSNDTLWQPNVVREGKWPSSSWLCGWTLAGFQLPYFCKLYPHKRNRHGRCLCPVAIHDMLVPHGTSRLPWCLGCI